MAETIIETDSRKRVAFDLALRISNDETVLFRDDPANGTKTFERDRKYWLELYSQCLQVVMSGKYTEDKP